MTVISDAVPDQIVVDAARRPSPPTTIPTAATAPILGLARRRLHTINEEHGYVDVSGLDERPAVGEHLQIIPNHACGCVNLHDGLLGVRDGVVDHVIRVAARGLVR